jgi:hypothetical protein
LPAGVFAGCIVLKKYLGILLLVAVTAPFPGTYAWLYFQKYQTKKEIKRQMIAGLDKSELVLLKFTPQESETELRWEHSREFEYKGQMYDVVEHNINNDTFYYWCWWDHAETGLNKKLDHLLASALERDTKHRETERQLVYFFKSLYFSEILPWYFSAIPERIIRPPADCFFYTSINSVPLLPPPEWVYTRRKVLCEKQIPGLFTG